MYFQIEVQIWFSDTKVKQALTSLSNWLKSTISEVLHTSVTALVAVVKYGHQLDDNCLMRIVTALWVSLCFLTNPHTICYSNLQVPWLLWLTLIVLLLHYCVPAFCLYKNFFFQFSRSLKRCKSNDDFWVLFTALEDLPLKIVFHQSHFSCSNVQWQNIHWVHKCRRPFAPGKHLVHLRLCKRQSCSILMLKYLCTGRRSAAYWPVRGPTHAASLPPPLDCHREKIPGVWLFELLGFGIFE